jgi:agmatinase
VRRHLAQILADPSGQIDSPGLLIDLDFGTQVNVPQIRLFDLGNVNYRPTEDNADRVGARAAHLCRNIINAGARPILLGGNHALAYYSIGALAERYPNLGVLQFDAHAECSM